MLNVNNDGDVGINQASPTARTHIKGSTSDNSAYALKVDDSSDSNLLSVRNDGLITLSKLTQTQLIGSLTDDAPTDAEIDSVTGLTSSTAGAGWQATIKDNDGSEKLYKIESDGTDWYYTVMNKAL